MKVSLAISTPEVHVPPPLALLSGSFEERLRKAGSLGYDGVELMPARPAELDVGAIHWLLAEMGLEVPAIASGAVYMTDQLTLLASDPSVSQQAEERLHAMIHFAAALRAPLVTIGGFRGQLAWTGDPSARERLVSVLNLAAEKAALEGVRLVLEPLNRYEADIVNTTSEGLTLLGEIGHSHIGLLLDTFHVNIEEASIMDCFRQAMRAGKLWHVHLGDSNRLPPGQGHIDFHGIFNTLQEIGYEKYLSAELLPKPDPDSAAEATIRTVRQLLRPIF